MEVLRTVLPRLIPALLLMSGAWFSFLESLYLQDQSVEFGEVKIAAWMWVFRAITTALVLGGALLLVGAVRKLL
jgi:hypothetical protein